MEQFSTRGLPSARKVPFWNEVSSEAIARMEIDPRDVGRFQGTLRRQRLGPLTILDVHSSAVRIRHTRAHVAAMPAASYLLLAPLMRDLDLAVEREAPIRIRAGEFCLLDHTRPYEVSHGDGARALCIDVDKSRLEEHSPGIAQHAGKVVSPDGSMSRLLSGVLRMLGSEMDSESTSELSPVLGPTLLEFHGGHVLFRARSPLHRSWFRGTCQELPRLHRLQAFGFGAVASHHRVALQHLGALPEIRAAEGRRELHRLPAATQARALCPPPDGSRLDARHHHRSSRFDRGSTT